MGTLSGGAGDFMTAVVPEDGVKAATSAAVAPPMNIVLNMGSLPIAQCARSNHFDGAVTHSDTKSTMM
ncbi:hypothetical protein GCM10010381_68260 [Streptomyces xantholiticus]|nr:hypothetical protein GCM10010381_68260 [Streptomyces xantholiticus]